MSTARISRHARISGDCPVCLYPLQGRNITKRPCEHMLCTPCYLEGVAMGFKDSSFNPDACEQCRKTPCTKTRAGSTLITSFTSSKQLMVAPVPATSRKERGKDSSRPRSVGPSASSAGDAGAEKRVPKERPKSKRRKVAEAKEREEDGGFALQARGQVRREGFFVPVGEARTCLPDALFAAMRATNPSLKLKQGDVRSALAASASSDPSFSMAKEFATQHGMDLHYEREINNPAALFRRRQGAFLAQLQISTAAGTDNHYVAYLAAAGYVIDNEAGAKVPLVDGSDRTSNKQAIKVFKQLFPRASSIFLRAVSSVSLPARAHTDRKSRFTCGLLFAKPIDIWSSTTKPTHEDLFIELYDQQLINYDELVDCIK